MVCPKCGSKTGVLKTRFNVNENEIYRYRVCKNENCGCKFYSAEFMIEENEIFNEQWKAAREGGRGVKQHE